MRIIDLDDPQSWHSDYNSLLNSAEVRAIIDEVVDPAEGHLSKWSLFERCDFATDRDVNIVHERCRHILQSNYTHVVAYHGCRISDPHDYTIHGILPSNPNEVVQRLIDCLPEYRDHIVNAASNCAKNGYIQTTEGYVCGLLSEKYARKTKTAYAMGSEYVRYILCEIGSELLYRKYALTGTPSLIRFRVPVEWLEEAGLLNYHLPIAIFPLISMMRHRVNPTFESDDVADICMKTKHLVSPHLIDEVIDMSAVMDGVVSPYKQQAVSLTNTNDQEPFLS